MKSADILIIGAGAVGCALARHLSRFQLDILLLEAADDVATGATKANSGIVHGGYTSKHGTLKGELCIRGNRMFAPLDKELNFGFKQTGSLVLAFEPSDFDTLEMLLENGRKNGVRGLEILGSEDVHSRFPNLNPGLLGALYCPETGIVSPYEYCIALAENAVHNGVELHLDTPVDSISKSGDEFIVNGAGREFRSRFVVNAAGVNSSEVAALAGAPDFKILPPEGAVPSFCAGAAEASSIQSSFSLRRTKARESSLHPLTGETSSSGLMPGKCRTPEDLGTDPESLAAVIKTARLSVPSLDPGQTIRLFSGIRPRGDRGDFIIEESRTEGFINLGGIESPGLTSSPAIALKVEEILREKGLLLKEKADFDPFPEGFLLPGAPPAGQRGFH